MPSPHKKGPGTLTPRQRRFVQEYLVDLNGTRAAIRAGYSQRTANEQASCLLTRPHVRAAVDAALAAREQRVEVKVDDVVRELYRLAFVDLGEAFNEEGGLKALREMSPDVRRSISSIEVEELWDGDRESGRFPCGKVHKIKFWPKVTALELLGKHLRMFIDRVEHSGGLTLEQLILNSLQPDKDK